MTLTDIFANISAHARRRWLKLWLQVLFLIKKIRRTDFFRNSKILDFFGIKSEPIHISYLHYPHGSIDQNRLVPDRIPESRTGPGRIKVSKPGPDQTRTKKNFEPWDRTGPGTRKISKYRTGPGPTKSWTSRTDSDRSVPVHGGPWIPVPPRTDKAFRKCRSFGVILCQIEIIHMNYYIYEIVIIQYYVFAYFSPF